MGSFGKDSRPVASRERDVHDPDAQGDPPPRRGLYRRVAGAFFASAIVYLIAVGLFSVIPQIFWPEHSELPEDVTCRAGLDELRGELLGYSAARVRDPADQTAPAPFFVGWDDRHVALMARCAPGEERDAWELLGRMRQRVQGTLERYDREEAELARAMDSTLAAREGR